MSTDMQFSGLTANEKLQFGGCYYTFFVNGALALVLGAMLPYIRASYGLSYQVSGMLISFHSIGNLISSFIAGIIPIYIGRRRSIMLLCCFAIAAFILLPLSGAPILLLTAFFFSGLTRGSISNFNNTVVNDIATGKAWALNLLHAVFAVGAFTSPFMVLFCTQNNPENWRIASFIMAALCLSEIVIFGLMPIPGNKPLPKEKRTADWGFLKNSSFMNGCFILFFYLCAEQAINGWLVSYFKDSGIMSANFAQTMSSLLWIVILIGRLSCAMISKHVKKSQLLLFSGAGFLVCFVLLISARSLLPAALGIIGVGFFMAGLYPTTVADIGDTIKKYPLSMSFLLTFAGLGAIIMPSIVGTVADQVGIIGGMSCVIVAALLTFVAICINAYKKRKV